MELLNYREERVEKAIEIHTIRTRIDLSLTIHELIEEAHCEAVGYEMDVGFDGLACIAESREVDLKLGFFSSPPLATDGSLFQVLSEMRLRAANVRELLTLGAIAPELQIIFPIAAFGSVKYEHFLQSAKGHIRYPCLDTLPTSMLQAPKRRFDCIWDAPYNNWSNKGGAILTVDLESS